MTFTAPQYKAEYQTECLLEVLNDEYKVLAIENNRNSYTQFEYEVGRKYIKVWDYRVSNGNRENTRSCFMFIDKNDGAVYKPASYKAPAKIVRYNLLEIMSREQCFARADWAGGYLYVR